MLFTPSRKKIKYFSSLNLFYTRTSVVIIDNVHLAAEEASTPDESSNLTKFRISAVLSAISAPCTILNDMKILLRVFTSAQPTTRNMGTLPVMRLEFISLEDQHERCCYGHYIRELTKAARYLQRHKSRPITISRSTGLSVDQRTVQERRVKNECNIYFG
jgi:hypothetical protein